NANVDVFDATFNYVREMRFSDPAIPAGFAPFNIRTMAGKIFVTYAKQRAPDNKFDEPGPGNGYVDIFNTDGSFVKRLASQGKLNSPWGIEMFKGNDGFGVEMEESAMEEENTAALEENTVILVGNFGDGRISAYDRSGIFLGQLMNGEKPIEI